jgi:hypothetical protein
MVTSSLGSGDALVYVPEETNPNEGGGPIRRSGLVTTRAGEGMPPYGPPPMIWRTPHQVVPDGEPGSDEHPARGMKFLPDGRLVPVDALGDVVEKYSDSATRWLDTFGALTGTVLGGLIGLLVSRPGQRWKNAGIGSVIGLGGGVVLTGIAKRGARLSAALARGA